MFRFLDFIDYLFFSRNSLYFSYYISVFVSHLFSNIKQSIMTVHNFTEFYNILKNNNGITNSISGLKNFVMQVETYKSLCSCNRKAEKIRLQNKCEEDYKTLVSTVVRQNIDTFHAVLRQPKIKFLYNNTMLGEF